MKCPECWNGLGPAPCAACGRVAKTREYLEPVTIGGWYETTEGEVTNFYWRDGRLHEGMTVASWADVHSIDDDAAFFEAEAAYFASKQVPE